MCVAVLPSVFPSSVKALAESESAPMSRGVEVGDIIIAVNCENVAGKVSDDRLFSWPPEFAVHVCLSGVICRVVGVSLS